MSGLLQRVLALEDKSPMRVPRWSVSVLTLALGFMITGRGRSCRPETTIQGVHTELLATATFPRNRPRSNFGALQAVRNATYLPLSGWLILAVVDLGRSDRELRSAHRSVPNWSAARQGQGKHGRQAQGEESRVSWRSVRLEPPGNHACVARPATDALGRPSTMSSSPR